VNVTMNHATMNRKGFVPYGPAPDGAEALSRIMATDLAGSPVTVNLLLLGGAAVTGLIPEDLPEQMRSGLLPASAMAEPIRWLCPQPRPESTTSGSLRASSPPGWCWFFRGESTRRTSSPGPRWPGSTSGAGPSRRRQQPVRSVLAADQP